MKVVIIPCSKEKRWDDEPMRGAVRADEAYTSELFELCKAYALVAGDEWLILSAKYGLLKPADEIPETYDVTFSRPDDPVISESELRAQALAVAGDEFVLLLPWRYEKRLRAALTGADVKFQWPFEGMTDLSEMSAWVRQALALTE